MKLRSNPLFPIDQPRLSKALSDYWRELATKVNKQGTATTTNANGDIGSLTISLVYSQAEVQALRDKCEILADDVRALKTAIQDAGVLT